MKRIRFLIVLWLMKLADKVFVLIGRGQNHGSGLYGLKLMPDLISGFTGIDYDKTFFITGTNGKSTTNNLTVALLRGAGLRVTTNLEGANMLSGIATTLIKCSSMTGRIDSDAFVFETDERYLSRIHQYLPARNLCVTNIQKDQVQRNGEPDYIYQKIREVIGPEMTVYVNNEEARAKSLERYAGKAVRYSVTENERSFVKNGLYDVTLPCPYCGSSIHFRSFNIENVGPFSCTGCGLHSEDAPEYRITETDYENRQFCLGGEWYPMPYEQPFFLYNYALAIAVAETCGVKPDQIRNALQSFRNISGRVETISYGTKRIHYIRTKQENPETLQAAFDFVAQDPARKILLFGLEQVEDIKPFYTNTFYAYDCDPSGMIASGMEHVICFSKVVAYDEANRLLYAGYPEDQITILPTDDTNAILAEVDRYDCDCFYMITLLHKYEELLAECRRREEARNA
ncbi:MAG: DUF1727 domain-containing protein [Mogibacterium sp.]|nr:DUF1727 domain-containing protein [Mogibacterium sp.]